MASEPTASDEIRRFEEQYRSNPEGLVFARLADAYRKAGELDRALSLLKEGIARHPDYPSAHIVRARTLVDLERPADAEASLRRVLELDGQNLVAMRGLASLAEKRKDPLEAVHWYEQISTLDPMNVEAEAALERLRRELPPTPPGLEPLPAPREEWWSSPAFDIAESRAVDDEEDEEPVDFSADGLGDRAANRTHEDEAQRAPSAADTASGPGPEPAQLEADEPAAGEVADADDTLRADDTLDADATLDAAVEAEAEARAGADGPGEREAPRAWWFEDPADEEPSDDGDLLTRTMAELYAKQGLVDEAIAIYRELLVDRPADADLRQALDDLLARTDGETATASAATDERGARVEGRKTPEKAFGSPAPSAGAAPVATDGSASDAESTPDAASARAAGSAPDPYASHPVPRAAGESETYRDWIRRLSE